LTEVRTQGERWQMDSDRNGEPNPIPTFSLSFQLQRSSVRVSWRRWWIWGAWGSSFPTCL